jgi:transcriptional regulator with XRE-family HTH domain
MPEPLTHPNPVFTGLHAMSDPAFRKALGQRLKSLRKDRGLTQKDLAQAVSLSFQQLNKYESGVNLPSADVLAALADHLDVTLDYLAAGKSAQTITNTRLLERLKSLEGLPSEDLEAAITVLDGLVVRREVEASINKRIQQRKIG